jgi:hypothetical protein
MSGKQCIHDKMSQVMKEFEKNKLTLRNKKKVTDIKQAIAIGLHIAHSECKYNKEEIKQLIDKVEKDFSNEKKKILLSNLVELKEVISILNEKQNTRKINNFKNLLWNKIINQYRLDDKLDKNMWNEIYHINNI